MHALEAYTVSPYDTRPKLPLGERPPYQGANPFADPLCERAVELVGRHLRAATTDGSDLAARTGMALASTIAGIAFSGAGVHIPHALAYPIASLQHEWRPPGYGGAALVPHGFAVAVTAPAVFRFIADAAPERCATAARLLDGGDDLAASLEALMTDIGAPTRLSEIGYDADDLAAIVPGALDQRRLLVGSPKEVGAVRPRGRAEGVTLTGPGSTWPSRVAVVGAGTMGIGIAHVFASSGIPTVLADATPELSDAARDRAVELLSGWKGPGTSASARPRSRSETSSVAPSIADAVHGADLVVEAVVERSDVKLAVYAEIEPAAGEMP